MRKRHIIITAIILFIVMLILFLINIEILKIYLIFLILITVIIISIFFVVDIQGKTPITTKLSYNIMEKKYSNRKVFIMISKVNNNKNKYILYLHGGAYVLGTSYKHWQFLEDIVDRTGSILILPDYPLAPKNTYKEVFNMIIPLYKEIIRKVGKDNVILMGDSAGGGMALGLLQKIGQENGDMPYQTILLSPWIDVSMKNPEIDKIEKIDPVLIKEGLKVAGKAYAGEDGMENYLVNPIIGPLEKLKNIIIYTGTRDMLNPDIHILMERAKKLGADIKLREKENAIHIWMTHVENKNVLFAKETFEEIVNLLNGEEKDEI